MRELRTVRLVERALARRRAARRHVRRLRVELFYHSQWCEAGAAAGRQRLEPPPLFIPDVGPRDIERERHPGLTFERHERRFLHCGAAWPIHVCPDTNRRWI